MIWKTTNSVYSRSAVYILFAIISFYFNYFIVRSNTFALVTCYSSLFALHFLLTSQYNLNKNYSKEIITVAVIIRILLLFSLPNLSDDYYRFVWDGALQLHNLNPYQYTPDDVLHLLKEQNNYTWLQADIFQNLNSKTYFSIYPPFCQWIFYLVNILSPDNLFLQIILLKTVILFFEIITLLTVKKILVIVNLHANQIIWYAMNPLVIIELTGNLHMEAIMISFLVVAIYLLLTRKFFIAAIFLGLSVSTKLWPLIFLPLLFKFYEFHKSILISTVTIAVLLIGFIPFLNMQILYNYSESFQLYFQTFEFNASVYYLLKWISGDQYAWKQIIQIILPALVFAFIMYLVFAKFSASFITLCLLAFSIYFILATTVHPWYITPLILLSSLTQYRFAIIWSALICGTYVVYATEEFKENYFIIAFEYIIVFLVIAIEIKKNHLSPK